MVIKVDRYSNLTQTFNISQSQLRKLLSLPINSGAIKEVTFNGYVLSVKFVKESTKYNLKLN